MKEGSIPAALMYRIQYKVMNTCNSRVLLKTTDRETTLFVTDMTKANVSKTCLIKWDEIDLPESWTIEQITGQEWLRRWKGSMQKWKEYKKLKELLKLSSLTSWEALRRNVNSKEWKLQKRWYLQTFKDGESVKSEFSPTGKFILTNNLDTKQTPIMASPFKTKNLEELIGPKDIKNIMEHANYTNKYLQTLGQKLNSPSNSTQDPPKAL
ncbi:hypothetical protein AHAS_Ahas15G0255200 [Arachis hypogaea]